MASNIHRFLLSLSLAFILSATFSQSTLSHAERLLQEMSDPSSGYILIAAHRGGWERDWKNRAPENSLANIDKAVKMGFDVFETDLAMSKDGVLVMMHDKTVDRTTNGGGKVENLTLAELQSLQLKYTNDRLSDQTVPTFAEFLDRAKGKILFKIDYRPALGTFPQAVALVEEKGMMGQVFFRFDYDEEVAAALRGFVAEGMPWHPNLIMFRTRTPEEVEAAIEQFDLGLIEVYFDNNELTEQGLAALSVAKEAGLFAETHNWGKRGVWEELIDAGFRMFHTRQPENLLRYLKRQGLHEVSD